MERLQFPLPNEPVDGDRPVIVALPVVLPLPLGTSLPDNWVLDDDIEEFVEARTNLNEVLDEIEILFENPPAGDKTLSEDNQAILALMDFESNKKAFIKEKKAEGMELAEAKEAYEFAKAAFVREALGLPEPEEEE